MLWINNKITIETRINAMKIDKFMLLKFNARISRINYVKPYYLLKSQLINFGLLRCLKARVFKESLTDGMEDSTVKIQVNSNFIVVI